MKKLVMLMILSVVVFSVFSAYALDTGLFDVYNEILEESKRIKTLLETSQDIILVNSMWDSCIMTMTELEAYFNLLRIFNKIKQENLDEETVGYLGDWLNKTKKTNELNIKSLNAISRPLDPNTEVHIAALKVYLKKLNKQIDAELEKISTIKNSLKTR